MGGPEADPIADPVTILLATYNGEAFLPDQLASIAGQVGADWRLVWRDDGSSDRSAEIVESFADRAGQGRCRRLPGGERLGVTGSYMALLRAAVAEGAGVIAFADQDDVWLPEKLERGLAGLRTGAPCLYCARQILVDATLRRLGESPSLTVPPGLGPALTQNVATGCTVMLDPGAARLIASSDPPPGTLHDWWSYLVVAAAGGAVVADPEPVVLYRQHAANVVGAPGSAWARAAGALRRGPGQFMGVLRAHVAGLLAQPHLLAPRSAALLATVAAALAGPRRRRLPVLRRCRLHRQTPMETLLFRLWFLFG